MFYLFFFKINSRNQKERKIRLPSHNTGYYFYRMFLSKLIFHLHQIKTIEINIRKIVKIQKVVVSLHKKFCNQKKTRGTVSNLTNDTPFKKYNH